MENDNYSNYVNYNNLKGGLFGNVFAAPDEEEDQLGIFDMLMTFDTFQTECKKTAIYPEEQGLSYTALGLAGESGEYADKIKKYMRDGTLDDRGAMRELGDVLWYVAMAADELGYDLSEVAFECLEKLRSRKDRGVLGGSGDNR